MYMLVLASVTFTERAEGDQTSQNNNFQSDTYVHAYDNFNVRGS